MSERLPSPYHPGFNQPPEHLAGRGEIIESFTDAFTTGQDGLTPTPIVLVGDRGVGKSVLLVEARHRAAMELGWPAVAVEARQGTPLDALVASHLLAVTAEVEQTSTRRWKTERFTVRPPRPLDVAEITVSRASPTAGDGIDAALGDALAAVVAKNSGLVLTIDEVHTAGTESLSVVAAALQALMPQGWPLVVVLAGLPSLRHPGNMVTYLERCVWHEVGHLGRADAHEALTVPAADAGQPWDDDAASVVVNATGGYPFAIQIYGHHSWLAAGDQGRINLTAAAAGVEAGERRLAASVYIARWEAAPERERAYLTAAAALVADSPNGSTSNGEIAEHLGTTAQALSSVRQRCLDRGNIIASGRTLRFPTPGMATWILTQDNQSWT